MIGRAMIFMAALVGLGTSASRPNATPEDIAPLTRPMRKSRFGAETPKKRTTKPRGKRCRACGTGGHARLEAHGRR